MPGAQTIAGSHRVMVPLDLPQPLPTLAARVDDESIVHLAWERSARTIGLAAEVHRGTTPDFAPTADTRLAATPLFALADAEAPQGTHHYALVLLAGERRSAPVRATVTVPPPQPPPAPTGLVATPAPGCVELRWRDHERPLRYVVLRAKAGTNAFKRLTAEPSPEVCYTDATAREGATYAYTVRAVSRRGLESAPASPVVAAPMPEIKEPVFAAEFAKTLDATLLGGAAARGIRHGKARVADGVLDLRQGGYVSFAMRPAFGLDRKLSVEVWVNFAREAAMPVVVSCGHWRQAGWFLQRIGRGWRWHVGGTDCDGGKPAVGRWTHLVGTFDGATARLFQDGDLVAETPCAPVRTPWRGPLLVGQYSGGPRPPYQVLGRLRHLRIHNRTLSP